MQRDRPINVAGQNGGGAVGGTTGGQGGAGGVRDNPTPGGGVSLGGFGGMDMECAGIRINASRILPTVMLVVDGSTSMVEPYGTPPEAPDGGMPDPSALPTRWTSVREALVGADGVVPKLQDRVNFGLAVFGTNATCPLPLGVIAPTLNNAAAITGGIPQAPPGTYTPTGVALDEVVKMLPDPTMVLDGPPIGPQIILLATDGNPNACNAIPDIFMGGQVPSDYGPSIAAANAAAAKHLKMYVISVGMDAAAAHLQEMANIGQGMDPATGTAEVHYPENTAGLTATLETLIGAELSCDLSLEGKGIRVDLACSGTVKVNGMELECNGPNGFELVDEKTLRLNGTTCDMYKNSVDTLVDANFPCEAVIIE